MVEIIDLRLVRTWLSANACAGTLMVRGRNGWEKFCATLEDIPRDEKVYGETAIPATGYDSHYEVELRTVLSDMTKKYRKRFSWFDWHLELQNVPNYTNVYMHVGNRHQDTLGCILVGTNIVFPTKKGGDLLISGSVDAYHNLYDLLHDHLVKGGKVRISIIEEFTGVS